MVNVKLKQNRKKYSASKHHEKPRFVIVTRNESSSSIFQTFNGSHSIYSQGWGWGRAKIRFYQGRKSNVLLGPRWREKIYYFPPLDIRKISPPPCPLAVMMKFENT